MKKNGFNRCWVIGGNNGMNAAKLDTTLTMKSKKLSELISQEILLLIEET